MVLRSNVLLSSDTFAAIQRLTFADKITLGQSAVLGIMCVRFPWSRSPSAYPQLYQPIKSPFCKPIQLARDHLLPLLPRFRVSTKLGPSEVARREMDEVCQKASPLV